MISTESEKCIRHRFLVLNDEPIYELIRIEVDLEGQLSYHYLHKHFEVLKNFEGAIVNTPLRDTKDYSKEEIKLIPKGVKNLI